MTGFEKLPILRLWYLYAFTKKGNKQQNTLEFI
jgi:hypothetical protein